MAARSAIPARAGVLALALALAAFPLSAVAQQRSIAGEAGLGVLAVASTLIWGTAKTVVAVVGGLTGSLAWAVTGGRKDIAQDIFVGSMRGDYVVTPAHLTGEKGLVFVGRDSSGADFGY